MSAAQQDVLNYEDELNKEPDNLVKFKTQDELLLAGYYYSGAEQSPGVLLLHDCANNGASYLPLAQALSELGINALALDLRGYGYSANVIYSHDFIKKTAKDLNMYQSEVVRITSYWESDIVSAYHYLQNKIGKEQPVSVVSSGCTAPQAVYLAEKIRIRSLVIVTPKFSHLEKEKYKNLIDIPAYFLSSAHHANSYQIAKELFEWNGDLSSTMQVIKGNDFGHDLLNGKPYLIDNIATWLQMSLKQ
ncbi:alpha/beta hydrolase [Thalassotalea piscium]|uniref:alpha/beta hydrolase n=1 Tax=Thalassotalea piscium TaxID=1230533 RepID=UPI0016091BFE|nr:alpha/beta fold hydrolase [Thalassotalea piscium]